ncbi:MAG: heavy metal-binding domain-containing protein, partial [bacterium]
MRKEILALVASAVALVTLAARAQVGATDPNRRYAEQEHEQEKKQKYTCRMHPEVITDHAGNCAKCGMKLVPLKQNTNSEHMMHHGDEMAMPHHDHGGHEMQMEMHSSINLADPMNREGSGTSWLPDSSPMYGRMFMFEDNMLMLHGAIFPRYTNVSTRRGDDRIDAPNWFMAMYSHLLGDSTQFGSRLMMSLDPLTEGGRGYPLLFQSGESWHDQPLHDRQHPHDLFDELSMSLAQKFDHDVSAYFYFGYPGEPALGPPTFM